MKVNSTKQSFERRFRRALLTLWLAGLALCMLRGVRKFAQAEAITRNPSYDAQERVGFWMLSARCTQLTGSFLAICRSDRTLVPIEEVSLADDRGHAFLASLVARGLRRPFERFDLTR